MECLHFHLYAKYLYLAYDIHHFLLGLLGYLILIATQAFVPQRQFLDRRQPSPLPVPLVSTNFISTLKVLPFSYKTLVKKYPLGV